MKELPRKSFMLPQTDSMKPNEPQCICEHCEQVIYETNFYHCPVKGFLVWPMHDRETMAERFVSKDKIKTNK